MTGLNQIKIRKVLDEDLPEVFPMIDKEDWYWTMPEMEQLFKTDKKHSIVAILNNEIIGLLFAIKRGCFASWTHFIVKEEYRGIGVGAILMKHTVDDLKTVGVDVIDIIAIDKFVPLYKKAGFEVLEDLLLYSKKITHSVSEALNRKVGYCSVISLKELEESGTLLEFEKQMELDLNEFEGKSVFGGLSPIIGYYEDNILEGIMFSHISPYGVDIGPWVIQNITPDKIRSMLHYVESLFKNKEISLSISSKNRIVEDLVKAEGFNYVEKLTHMTLCRGSESAYSNMLVSVGKF